MKSASKWSRKDLDLGRRLFVEYRPFVCDSALHYQNRNIEIAEYLQDAELVMKLKIEQALLLGTTGLYNEAIELHYKIAQCKCFKYRQSLSQN